ncbi:hypothetical protein C0991_002844 [Blastosporella zonata]|nr:hypothetical protein C0991_002844 [Blastosporella zonata]
MKFFEGFSGFSFLASASIWVAPIVTLAVVLATCIFQRITHRQPPRSKLWRASYSRLRSSEADSSSISQPSPAVPRLSRRRKVESEIHVVPQRPLVIGLPPTPALPEADVTDIALVTPKSPSPLPILCPRLTYAYVSSLADRHWTPTPVYEASSSARVSTPPAARVKPIEENEAVGAPPCEEKPLERSAVSAPKTERGLTSSLWVPAPTSVPAVTSVLEPIDTFDNELRSPIPSTKPAAVLESIRDLASSLWAPSTTVSLADPSLLDEPSPSENETSDTPAEATIETSSKQDASLSKSLWAPKQAEASVPAVSTTCTPTSVKKACTLSDRSTTPVFEAPPTPPPTAKKESKSRTPPLTEVHCGIGASIWVTRISSHATPTPATPVPRSKALTSRFLASEENIRSSSTSIWASKPLGM